MLLTFFVFCFFILASQEATKRAFENWKVWENYCAVSVDVGSFHETIRGIERLLVLKEQYNDWQVRVLSEATKWHVRSNWAPRSSLPPLPANGRS